MKQITFFVDTKLDNRDKLRLGIKYFLIKKIKVNIFNIAPYTRENYFKNYNLLNRIKFPKEKILKNEIEILDAIGTIDKNTFVIFLPTREKQVKFIIDEFERRNIKYGYIFRDKLPSRPKNLLQIVKLFFRFPLSSIRRIFFRINKKSNFAQNPHFVFCSGIKYYEFAKTRYKNSRIIKIPSYDHDKFLLFNKKKLNLFKKSKDYAVYLDTGYNHPDLLDKQHRFPIQRPYEYQEFYEPKIKFFKKFKEVTNLDLKIAVHPRTNFNKNPYLKLGKVYRDKTLELISRSKIVLTHFSGALSWAVLLKKPLLFFLQDINEYDHKMHTRQMAEYFQKEAINISNVNFNKIMFEKQMKVDKKIYKLFKKQFIVDLQNPNITSYEIIFNNIKQLKNYKSYNS